MKMNKSKFDVKTTDKEIIEVEGRLIMVNDQSKPRDNSYFPKPKQPSLRELIINIQKDIWHITSRLNNIDSRLQNVEQDIKLMKNTPTMKRELQNS